MQPWCVLNVGTPIISPPGDGVDAPPQLAARPAQTVDQWPELRKRRQLRGGRLRPLGNLDGSHQSLPLLEELRKEFPEADFQIVAVNVDADPKDVRAPFDFYLNEFDVRLEVE